MKRQTNRREEILENIQKIVVKVGTSTLTKEDGNLNIEKIKKINLIDASFSGVNKYVVNVVKILAGNLQISLINFVLEQFTELFNRYSNSVVVKVESASPLTELQLENLKEKLKNELQLEKVELNNFVDESLLGGFKLTYNNKVVDASIKAKLSAIKAKISTI